MQASHISSYISSSTSKIIVLLMLLIPVHAMAQKHRIFAEKNDSTPLFNGVAVWVDLVGAGQMMLSDYGQYEAGISINLKDRYYPTFEMGYGKCEAVDSTTNLKFTTQAPYFKIGCDFNLLKNKHDIYRLYGGLRYAFTSYKYDVEAINPIIDPVWGGEATFSSTDNSAYQHWMEAVFGLDAKIAGPLYLGWSVRYRRRLFHKDGNSGNTYYIPGYGRAGGSRLGATFNVIFKL